MEFPTRYRDGMAARGREDGDAPWRPEVRLVASDLDGTLLRPGGWGSWLPLALAHSQRIGPDRRTRSVPNDRTR